jgi:hypothetical protein
MTSHSDAPGLGRFGASRNVFGQVLLYFADVGRPPAPANAAIAATTVVSISIPLCFHENCRESAHTLHHGICACLHK